MKTETLKINVAQRILSISETRLLQKIRDLLDKENVFAYDANGNPITESDYVKSLDQSIPKLTMERHNFTAPTKF